MNTALAGAALPRALPAADRSAGPSRGVIAATVAGNALEFYDFVTYAFFAVYIGKTFFPAGTPLASLLLTVAVFGVGFVSRPLGGVLIGAYADRAGRKPAMLLTIVLITVGTLGLALTPSYAQIGMAAPIIVVACRLVQGLALGGEVGPSTAYLIEIAPPGRRGLMASWQLASQGLSTVVAGSIGVLLTTELSADELARWGWRLPFLVGLLLLPIAVYMRRNLSETLHEGAAHAVGTPRPKVREHAGLIGLAIMMIVGGTVATYVGNYMTTYAITTLKMAPAMAMVATVVVGCCIVVASLLGGTLSDRFGRKPVMIAPRVLLALLVYPAFQFLVGHPTPGVLFLVVGMLASLNALASAPALVAIPEQFPRAIRATGLAIAYAVGVAIFGGSTQFIVTWLIAFTHDPLAPGLVVALTSVVTLLATLALPESLKREI